MSGAIGNDFCSFGALLKTFRQRRQLTQKQLAAAIGMHRNAIGRWEQGDFLPASKAIILELARHLQLNEQETLQILEASLTALSPHWQIPFPRNPFFTGREQILDVLHARLGVNQIVALTQSYALHGLGGIGKTQIALEYAYRYALEYSAIFWIEAETAERVVSSLLRIAEVLQLSQQQEKDHQRIVAAVQQWLTTHKQWLLICDNAEDLAMLERFLPSTRSGAILITTRCQALGTLAQSPDLLPMDQEEGVLFLLRRAKALSLEDTAERVRQLAVSKADQYSAARNLVEALGGLPLALDQAGAYIEETGCSLSGYLHRYEQQRHHLLDRRGALALVHPQSVAATLWLSCQRVAASHPAALELLRFCSFFSPDAIPEELLIANASHLGPMLGPAAADLSQFDQAIAALRRFSLLQRQPEQQTLSMHRLVQAVLLDAMTEAEREQWNMLAIETLDVALPEVNHTTEHTAWKQCERLLPHVLLNLQRSGEDSASLPLASLAYKAGTYLLRRAWYTEAKPLLQRALQIQEQALGPEHPEVAASLRRLALLLLNQSKFAEAEPLMRQALHIREQALGPEHPEVADSLNGLAALFHVQGKYTEAEPLYLRALHIRGQALGPEHPEVAILLNNLAELYWWQGRYAQAELFSQRALQIQEQALGPEHPVVVRPLSVLANLFREQGKFAEAESLYLQALQIQEQAQALEHPLGAILLNDLADCYRMQCRDVEAEPLYLRALQIHEQALGPAHPNVSDPLNGLANLSRDQGHYPEAERLYRRALSLREQNLGPDHPDTAQTLYDLALLRQRQGKLYEALSLAERSLQIREQVLVNTHPKTIATRTLYAQLLQEQAGFAEKADSEHEKKEISDTCCQERQGDMASLPLHNGVDPSSPTNDSLQKFLDACCELHPLASCQISDLWQTYMHWTASYQKCIPLSRRAFSVQLKLRGCCSDRTSTTRIWRGIRLVYKTL